MVREEEFIEKEAISRVFGSRGRRTTLQPNFSRKRRSKKTQAWVGEGGKKMVYKGRIQKNKKSTCSRKKVSDKEKKYTRRQIRELGKEEGSEFWRRLSERAATKELFEGHQPILRDQGLDNENKAAGGKKLRRGFPRAVEKSHQVRKRVSVCGDE